MKKVQATEQYITGLDSTQKEKLEFVKTQSMLFQKMLPPPEMQNERCKRIIQYFEQSAMQFPIKKSSEGPASEARKCGSLSALKEVKQLMSQEQMRAIYRPIFEDPFGMESDTLPEWVMNDFEWVIIDFDKEYLAWHEVMFLLDDAVIEIEFFSTNSPSLTDPLMNVMQIFKRLR